jgi:glycosyltransferase involved in cell wall biosynthesis
MRATISCIVPVYNGARFLGEALDSILAQSLPPSEIIVVDDGSTDATPDVVAAYAKQVSYVRQVNAGPSAARNRGIELASGEFLAFLDADDLWDANKLERQLQALQRNPAAGICTTYFQNFWIDELANERDLLRDHDFAKPLPGYVCQCLLARRSVFDIVGRFDETRRIGEDLDWFARAEQAGIVKEVLHESLVRRRIHGQNISYEVYRSEATRTSLLLDLVVSNIKRHRQSPSK